MFPGEPLPHVPAQARRAPHRRPERARISASPKAPRLRVEERTSTPCRCESHRLDTRWRPALKTCSRPLMRALDKSRPPRTTASRRFDRSCAARRRGRPRPTDAAGRGAAGALRPSHVGWTLIRAGRVPRSATSLSGTRPTVPGEGPRVRDEEHQHLTEASHAPRPVRRPAGSGDERYTSTKASSGVRPIEPEHVEAGRQDRPRPQRTRDS